MKEKTIKDKLLRILVEQDMYKQDESDTINSDRYPYIKYKITYNGGWWDLEKFNENKCVSKVAFQHLSRLVRDVLFNEEIKY